MHKNRLEAFSDGVIAIIITIMVLELRPPHTAELSALKEMLSTFSSYVLSFIFLGIYWNNHHHLFQAVKHVNGGVLWANLHLLFWLSLIPFTTAWVGENHLSATPVALYGVNLLFAGISYFILNKTLITSHGKNSLIAQALGENLKGKISIVFYILGILLAFVNPLSANLIYMVVAIIWLVPDKRIEKILLQSKNT